MGAPGWDDAKLRAVAMGAPHPITLIWPYYENPRFLEFQVHRLAELSRDLKQFLNLIVVDDGSPEHPAAAVLQSRALPIPTQLYRIMVDVRWNWLAARNIAMHHAGENWCALTDIDHVWPEPTLAGLVHGIFPVGEIFRFKRREHSGAELLPHPNSFLIERATFWKVGGYDEALSGFYGTDGDWRRRCAATAPVNTLPFYLVRHEHQGDSSTIRYLRKQPVDAGKKAIIRKRGAGWRPKVLSFPYQRIEGVT